MIIIVMGVSGCGKSTVGERLAQRLGYQFLDADAYHSPENVAKMSQGIPLNEADRAAWLASLREAIADHLQRGESAVLACSALTRQARQVLRVDESAVRFVHLKGSAELIRQRMEGREHFMPPTLLDSQFAALEPPTPDEAVTVDIAAEPEALVEQIIRELPVTPPKSPRTD